MATVLLPLPADALARFCEKWKIRELALFGSVLRDDFRPDSDLDVLVTFADDADWGLWDAVRAEEELRDLVGRRVDLVDRRTIENSENWIRRRSILGTARTVYGG